MLNSSLRIKDDIFCFPDLHGKIISVNQNEKKMCTSFQRLQNCNGGVTFLVNNLMSRFS